MRHKLRFLLAGIALVVALPAFADYEQAFREGVRNFGREKWADAIEFLKVAIELRPIADGHPVNINGALHVGYTPYHYLAASYAHLGKCDVARSTLKKAKGDADNPKLRKVIDDKCPVDKKD